MVRWDLVNNLCALLMGSSTVNILRLEGEGQRVTLKTLTHVNISQSPVRYHLGVFDLTWGEDCSLFAITPSSIEVITFLEYPAGCSPEVLSLSRLDKVVTYII